MKVVILTISTVASDSYFMNIIPFLFQYDMQTTDNKNMDVIRYRAFILPSSNIFIARLMHNIMWSFSADSSQ